MNSTCCCHNETIQRLTRERDEAKKMRDYHEGCQRVAESSVATLSNALTSVRKERDEALASRDSWNAAACKRSEEANELRHELATLRATQSSPEVLALHHAARWYGDGHAGVRWKALQEAAVAFSAVQRKAEPKPRYEVVVSSGGWPEGGCVRSVATQELVFGVWRTGTPQEHAARCRAECDKLNAADAAGRKS